MPKNEDGDVDNEWNEEASTQETSSNRILVDWDGENDPENPLNWSKSKRISQVILVSAITLVT
jgi:hypothetical protein